MTTTDDPFTDAARAYARERYPSGTDLDRDRRMVVDEFAVWARTHLAAQEPIDAEVEAAARAISAEQDRRIGLKAGAWWGGAEYRRNFAREDARAALSAARAARRDEEKR